MPSDSAKIATAKEVQRGAAKRATLDLLRSKQRQTKELTVVLGDEEVSFLLKSISAQQYDKLITNCPPNSEQRAAGSTYNVNKFAPLLLSRVINEPEMSEDEWGDIWRSPDWNRGELMTLFGEAVELCNAGLRLGPTASG